MKLSNKDNHVRQGPLHQFLADINVDKKFAGESLPQHGALHYLVSLEVTDQMRGLCPLLVKGANAPERDLMHDLLLLIRLRMLNVLDRFVVDDEEQSSIEFAYE